MSWIDLIYGVGSKLTSLKMEQLRDNLQAMADVDSGAPIVHSMLREAVNFGFTVAIDTPAAGDIQIAFKQNDNSSDATAAAPVSVGFPGTTGGLELAAAKTLKIDSLDHFGLNDLSINKEVFLFIYAIDRNGTLEWGVGRRPDYTRATADFVNTEGAANTRNEIFCTAAITANDKCYIVGYFKATYNTTGGDWDSLTTNSDVAQKPPATHPDVIAKAWVSFDANAVTSTTLAGVREYFNVAALATGGNGNIQVFWGTDFPTALYTVVATQGTLAPTTPAGQGCNIGAIGTNVITVECYNTSSVRADQNYVGVVAFGEY